MGARDTAKRTNLQIRGFPEAEEREKGTESVFLKIVAENVPNLGRDLEI